MATETFRTSLNGFNRTDVVQFIQKMTTNHEKELKTLREENEKSSEALELLRDDQARLEAQNAELTEKLAALEAQNAALEAQNAELTEKLAAKAAEPSPAPAAAPAAPVSAQIAEHELAAYRRAEGMERKARERAEATTKLLKGVFAKATDRLNAGSAEFAAAAEKFRADYEHMQQLLADAKGVFDASADEIRAADAALDEK